MKYEITDILKEKGTKTNCLFKVLDIIDDYYYCEQGFLERDTFIGEARYVKIPFKNEDNFHTINDYLEDIEMEDKKEDSQTLFLGLTETKIKDIITLKVQGKTSEEISNYTGCCLSNVEAVLKTHDFLESRETLEKDEYIAKCNELEFANKNLQEELQMVYREIARRFLFHKNI